MKTPDFEPQDPKSMEVFSLIVRLLIVSGIFLSVVNNLRHPSLNTPVITSIKEESNAK